MRRQRQKRIRNKQVQTNSACWCCGHSKSKETRRILGTQRRLCDECLLLGEQQTELEGRSRELFSYVTWEGFVPNKHRRKVELLGRHSFPEISKLAEELLAEDELQRKISAASRDREFELMDQLQRNLDQWLERRSDRLGVHLANRFG
ncbi:MAG: hypothetical protein AAF939_22715 [Planctomycetota bacterium]